jgi:hypothetical protein
MVSLLDPFRSRVVWCAAVGQENAAAGGNPSPCVLGR